MARSKDAVTRLENLFDATAARMSERAKRLFREKYFRQIGSKPVSMEEQALEWSIMRETADSGGVDAAVSLLRAQGASTKTAIQYIKQMNRAIGVEIPGEPGEPSSPKY